ncbi:MAG: carboxypeptidase-like regulatory domain-containing protein [Gemmatimonadota bacterium]|nr:carboxypeptidase-like regulatory domain-containing protein [Gemmatimonadota bacterium]
MAAFPRSVIFLLVALGAAGIAAAQTTASIRGTVLDAGGQPLEGVEILVAGIERSAVTNSAGIYRFNDVPVGERPVTARRPGYTAGQRTVTVVAGQVAVLDFQLQVVAQQLDSVSVTERLPPPVLLGWVHDTFGRPLEGVEVVLRGVNRTVQTNANGRFRFDSLEVKQYQLTARFPGYVAGQSLVPVRAAPPTEVALRLRAFAQVLETVEVDADRNGLYGTVSTTDLEPVVNAEVKVYGGGMTTRTDSAGRFAFPDIKSGDYLVGAASEGLEVKPMQVEMPRRRRLEIAITMEPENVSRRPVPGQRWVNHDLGLELSFSPSWKRMTRSELDRFRGRQLCDIARIRSIARGTEATIILDGVRALNPWSLCAFNADEVSMVTWGRGCTLMGMVVRPPPLMACLGVWTR